MMNPRLDLALSGGDALPASGDVLVIGPHSPADLADLPKDRLLVVQGFFPDHEVFLGQGFRIVPALAEAGDGFSAAIVFMPRSRSEARARVAEAAARVRPGGPVWIDGQKTEGIDTMVRDLRTRAPISAPIAKAHGKIFSFPAGAGFDDWLATQLHPVPGFITVPGVFSADKPDRGSDLLAAALPAGLKGSVVDLGAGWGYLAAAILSREGVTHLDLVEADYAALACARQNITDPRAAFHWGDATKFRPESRPQTVVMNPPFHTGRAADPSLGAAFIAAAAGILSLSGTLFMVANRHLPYEAALASRFREVEELKGDGAFKILRASKPLTRPQTPGRPAR
ncbi:MAG: methyltransferase [Albidovulum sp.]